MNSLPELPRPSGGLIAFSTRRRVTIAMVTFAFVLFGAIALFDLKVGLLPDLSYPTLTVRTDYTGAAPTEMETLVTQPVEEAVGVVKNLRKLKSTSRTGQSDVVLEFAWGTNMDQASIDVRDKLQTLQLPLDVTPPVLLRFNPSTEPIMRLALTAKSEGPPGQSDQAGLMRLRRYAEDELKKRLEPVAGVAAVKVAGGLEDEVEVAIDQNAVAEHKLSIAQVTDRLKQENVNISGGRIEEGSQRYLVRTVNQFTDLEQMRELLIVNQNGVPIRLRDIATVSQGYKDREAIIRLGGNEAVELAIYKEGDANTVNVANAVKKSLEELKKGLPYGTELTTIQDQSIFIEDALHDVRFEALLGGVFAILIIFFFLHDGWSTFVIGLSLPVSIITTFFFMGQFGLNLNVMSLAGLALATGLVVDDSIVVLESIAKARERGLGVLDAAITGASEVSMAVLASTLTNVSVFFPLVFVQGVAGQLFKDQALTVSIALLISLAVSLTLIPMLSSLKARAPMAFDGKKPASANDAPVWRSFLNDVRVSLTPPSMRKKPPGDKPRSSLVRALTWVMWALTWIVTPLIAVALLVLVVVPYVMFGLSWLVTLIARASRSVLRVMTWVGGYVLKPYDWAAARYQRVLPYALRHPLPVLAGAGAAFAVAVLLATTLGTDLIPQFAQDRFQMTAKLPAGAQLRETDALVKEIEAKHGKDKGVEQLYGVSGTGTRLDANPTESGENVATLDVIMGEGLTQQGEARQTEAMRRTMHDHADVQTKFGRPQIFSFSAPLEIELRGQNLDAVTKAGGKLKKMMEGSSHFADIKSTVEEGFPEVQIRFDQDRAAKLGLTTRQIADQVVSKVRGDVATRYSFRDRKIDVLVRSQVSERNSVEAIRKIIVNPQSDHPVTLDAVADVVSTIGPSEIHRVDQVRVAVVSANLRDIDLGTAIKEVQGMVAKDPFSAEVRMHVGGQGEELEASIKSLLFAFALAIFLVYLVMASQFESLLHPFVILFTIPLAIVGAVFALWLDRSPISVVVFIGMILLVGIVVKNAILLIDKVNQLREAGVPKFDAICQGATSRLRPIVMTTLTALFGFAPLAIPTGAGSEAHAPMAITVIGGLLVSTLLTLVVIPVMYDLMDRSSDAKWRERGLRTERAHAAAVRAGAAQDEPELGAVLEHSRSEA